MDQRGLLNTLTYKMSQRENRIWETGHWQNKAHPLPPATEADKVNLLYILIQYTEYWSFN